MKKNTPIQRFFLLLKANKNDLYNVYAYSIFHGIVSLIIPLGIQAIVNLIQGGQVSTSWIILVVMVVLGVAAAGLLQLMQLRIIENMQQRIFVKAAFDFASRITRMKTKALDAYSPAELMNRFFDVGTVQKSLTKVLVDFPASVIQIVFGLLLLSFYNPVFIAFGFGLLLLVFAILILTYKRGMKTSLKESKYKYRMAHWLQQVAGSRESFKLASSSELHLKNTDGIGEAYLEARESHFIVLKLQYKLLVLFKTIVAGGLLIIGGVLVLNQQMNIGQFIAAEIVILLVLNSVEKLILSVENVYDIITALEKIGLVIDLELDSDEGSSFHETRQEGQGLEIEFKEVTFAYENTINPILNKVSLHIEPGQKVLLSGNNGTGKSTLLNLAGGFLNADQGVICVNGLPIENFKISEIRKSIGFKKGNEQIFSGTIADNITLGRPEISFSDLKHVIKNVQLENNIKSLTLGFDTLIGPDHLKLPQSTREKILLARNIIHQPLLLILEDGFESIEPKERRLIIDYLCSEQRNWTMLVVSTDSYMKEKCSKKIELFKA
jgi:ABC-type bacteriocin/lantibiotic exporter with double-glycine peptidase domain